MPLTIQEPVANSSPKPSMPETSSARGQSTSAKRNQSNKRTRLRKLKIKQKEVAHITSQIAIMTKSGVDIVSALASVMKQTKSPDAKRVLSEIHADVVSGNPFSAALARHRDVFGNSYVASITAGEASGKMSDILAELANLQRNELKLVRSLKTMAAYPIVLVVVSLTVITALLLFVLPQFAKIFDDYGAPLPLITEMLIVISNAMVSYCYVWIPLVLATSFGLLRYIKTESGKGSLHRLLLALPIVNDVVSSLTIGRICRLLGLLLDSGVPLLESLGLVKGATNNSVFRKILSELEQNVLGGNGLGKTLEVSPHIPDSAAEMIMTAERTGSMAAATQLIGEHFEEEGEEQLRGIVAVLEPAITVLMGAIVAFVVLAVALPMFDLANVVQK